MAVPTDQQILDALRTAYFEIATNGAASYSVNGRTFTSLDIDKLADAITRYETKIARGSRSMFAPISFNPMR
jgi:hypothetical protein